MSSPITANLVLASAASTSDMLAWIRGAKRAIADGAALPSHKPGAYRLAVTALGDQELTELLGAVEQAIDSGAELPKQVRFTSAPRAAENLTLMFPGQGSQRPQMLETLAAVFAPFDAALRELDEIAAPIFGCSLRTLIAAPAADDSPMMTDTYWAQASLGFVSAALARALERIGVRARFTVGHSYGELVALWRAGVLDDATLFRLTERRGSLMRDASRWAPGGMLAVAADETRTAELIAFSAMNCEIANLNSPQQTIVAGSDETLRALALSCAAMNVRTVRLQTACAFHSSAMQPAVSPFRTAVESLVSASSWESPRTITPFANKTAEPYAKHASAGVDCLSEQLTSRVRWRECCAALAAHGSQLFLEVGPGRVLSRTLGANVGKQAVRVLSTDPGSTNARTHLIELLSELHVEGVELELENLKGAVTRTPEANHGPTLRLVHHARDTSEPASPALRSANTGRADAITTHAKESKPKREVSAVIEAKLAHDQAVPLFLQDNNQVVRKYLELSSRVLDVVERSGERAGSPELFSRFFELNSDVTARYLELQQDAIDWLRHHGDVGELAVQRAGSASALALDTARARVAPTPAKPAAKPQPRVVRSSPPSALSWLQGELSSITGFPVEALSAEARLEELGIDSLARASLLERIGKYAPEARNRARELGAARTLGELANVIGQAANASEPEPAQESDWLSWLRESLSRLTGFPVATFTADAALSELGVDSLAFASLLEAAVKRSPAIGSRARELAKAKTVGEVSAILERASAPTVSAPQPEPVRLQTAPPEQSLEQLLLAAFASASPTTALSPEQSLESAGLSLVAIDRVLGELEAKDTRFALAGAHLRSFGSCREIAAFVQGLTASEPVIDHVERYVLRERKVPIPEQQTPRELVLIGEPSAALQALSESVQSAGGNVHLIACSEKSFRGSDQTLVPLELAPALAALIQTLPRSERGLEVLFYASSQNESLSAALETDVVALLSVAQALQTLPGRIRLAVVSDSGESLSSVGARGAARAIAQEWRGSERSVAAVRVEGPCAFGQLLSACFQAEASTDWTLADGVLRREVLATRQLRSAGEAGALSLGAEDVIVLLGGATGIGAEVACALAERHGCIVAAVGRTPYDGEPTLAHVEESALTGQVHALLSQSDPQVRPEHVRAYVSLLKRQRAIHLTAERLRSKGVRFHYLQADARDEQQLRGAFVQIKQKLGRVDLAIHAAGVLEDAVLESKSHESFRRVLHTKVLSAEYLRSMLADFSPKGVLLLSSLVSHTGNAGQSDYCAANEILNGLARRWSKSVDYPVISTLWSVWTETGIASDGVRRLFQREHMRGIGTAEGVARALRELEQEKSEPWVLFTSPRAEAYARGAARSMEVSHG